MEDLKSLDLSYNELDEMPVKALKALKSLDWANFHRYNYIITITSLSQIEPCINENNRFWTRS